MAKIIGRTLLLLAIIGLVATILITIVNVTSSNGVSPASGQTIGSNPLPQNRSEFQGVGRGRRDGGTFTISEILKNMGLIAGITIVTVLIRKVMQKLKPARRILNN
jgi:hypothetical protein